MGGGSEFPKIPSSLQLWAGRLQNPWGGSMVLEDHRGAPQPAAAEGWVFSKHTNVAPITALAWHSGLKDGRAGGGPGTALRRLHGDHVRRSPSDPPTLARCGPRAPRPRDAGPRTGSPPRALPLGRLPRLLGARPVRWPLRDQVSACSSSASVHIVPWTQVWTAAASLTPMCRLLLPGFSSTRRAKSATFGSAELSVAYRRHPSPHASPTCPPFPPRVGGTPRVCALVCCAIPKTASVPSNYRSAILILAVVVFAMQGKWAQVTLPQLLDRAIFVIVGPPRGLCVRGCDRL